MNIIVLVLTLFISLGLLNVWILRFNKKTKYRGNNASSMIAEFKAYGLPAWSVYVVGILKIVIAILLIIGLWHPFVTLPALMLLALLMLGAVYMHIKVNDTITQTMPAVTMFTLTIILAVVHMQEYVNMYAHLLG